MDSVLVLLRSSDALMYSLSSALDAYVENKQCAFPIVCKCSSV